MFILRAILIACAVILLFCFVVSFFGKKKSVSRPKSNSYPDQTKTEKVRVVEGKTIPRSYSTTLPEFNNVRRRSSDIYSDLLHTAEWRNKRERILKRDNYRCVYCGRRHVKLHVHHKYYSAYPNGVLVDPWNYPDDALITLCSYCHQRVHARKKIKVYHRRYTDNY